jgi:hypothetical protein
MVDTLALAKLIRDSGVPFRENARSYVFTCPRCQKSGKLAMFKDSGYFICHHCASDGFKGSAEFALAELLGLPIHAVRETIYGSAVPNLSDRVHLDLVDHWNENEDEVFTPLQIEQPVPEIVWPPDFVGLENPALFRKGAEYLMKRGLNATHVQTYDLKYSPPDKRVIFPVKVDGKLVGWQARYIGPTEVWDEELGRNRVIPKILTSKSLQGAGKRYLMFQDRLKGSEHCVLTEGPVSALKAHKCGGNVASMGKELTLAQLQTILTSGVRKLYIALDPDAGEDIMRVVQDTANQLTVYLMHPPQNFLRLDDPDNKKDIGDLSEDEVTDIFRAATPEPLGKLYISIGSLLSY